MRHRASTPLVVPATVVFATLDRAAARRRARQDPNLRPEDQRFVQAALTGRSLDHGIPRLVGARLLLEGREGARVLGVGKRSGAGGGSCPATGWTHCSGLPEADRREAVRLRCHSSRRRGTRTTSYRRRVVVSGHRNCEGWATSTRVFRLEMLPAIRDPACTTCAGPVVVVTGAGAMQRAVSSSAPARREVTSGCPSARRNRRGGPRRPGRPAGSGRARSSCRTPAASRFAPRAPRCVRA